MLSYFVFWWNIYTRGVQYIVNIGSPFHLHGHWTRWWHAWFNAMLGSSLTFVPWLEDGSPYFQNAEKNGGNASILKIEAVTRYSNYYSVQILYPSSPSQKPEPSDFCRKLLHDICTQCHIAWVPEGCEGRSQKKYKTSHHQIVSHGKIKITTLILRLCALTSVWEKSFVVAIMAEIEI